MTTKRFVILILIGMLMISAGAVFAQNGNGGDNGNGNGNNGNGSPACTADCPNNNGAGNANANANGNNNRNANANGNGVGNMFGNQMQNANGYQNQNGIVGFGYLANLPASNPDGATAEVADALVQALMDEYQAYAIYGAVIEQFGALNPFVNIQRAEEQHADALLTLFDRYDVTVPEMPVFDLPTFASVQDACSVAADFEIANFGMYDTILETVADYPDIVQVVTSLRNASEFSHLPALQRCAS